MQFLRYNVLVYIIHFYIKIILLFIYIVKICITDYGVGIPNNIKDQLFQEGFKYGDSGHTGLGLYIIKKTIERYGGEVEITNSKPRGATFIIKLPGNGKAV